MARLAGVLVLASAGFAATSLAASNDKYTGETEDGHAVKLVVDERGAVIRGAITAETECTDGFDPFRARVEFSKPLDRSGPKGFRDKGSFVEQDDRFSARYRYKIEAERESKRAIAGTHTLEVTFRRNGKEYTTCSVEELTFRAKRRN